MSLTSSAASLLQPLIVNDLVDSAGSARGIGYLPVLIILVLIIGAILNGVQQYFIQKIAESVARDARTQLVRKILRIPLDALENTPKETSYPASLMTRCCCAAASRKGSCSHSWVFSRSLGQ
ncbi:hypothetical protein LPB401_00030 [Rothia aeria]|nr:hypothetical protein LPB401_00030 [Rothia aeria]